MKTDNPHNNTVYLASGTSLANGKYIIEKTIGQGGFGIAYKAIQSGLNRTVCIKEFFLAGRCMRDTQHCTIYPQLNGESMYEKFRQDFVKEARTLASLHHKGVVEVIDIFDENNTSYMVMPFIVGQSLQGIVEQNGPLPYQDAVNYIAQVADAVGYIHERHILHRDIKPDNIMITPGYNAVLIDFGSAREFEEDKTQVQTTMLTHGYAPTEQYTRNSRKGSYTDIYAIGATLYYILTGKVPVEAAARFTEKMPTPKELNPNIPDETNRTIIKAMQLNSQDRHQSISEFMDDLRNINPSKPLEEKSKDEEQQREVTELKETKKNKTAIVVLSVLLAVLAVVTISGVIIKHKQDSARLARFTEIHNKRANECEMFISSVEQDRDGDHASKHFIIESLMSLKELENMENSPNFIKTGQEARFTTLLKDYRVNLQKAEKYVGEKYQQQVDLGLTDNGYCDDLKDRLMLIQQILEQSKNGSVAGVNLPKK